MFDLFLLLSIFCYVQDAIAYVVELEVSATLWVDVPVSLFFFVRLLVMITFEVVQVFDAGSGEVDAVAEGSCLGLHFDTAIALRRLRRVDRLLFIHIY